MVKKLNQTLLVKVEKTKFHNISVKTYPHKSPNVRSKELSLCTIEEIKRELKKQGVAEVKRVSIKKEGKTIETNTYIMHFNIPKIHEKSCLYNGENRAIHTQPIAMLQMPKIWPLWG